MLKLRKHDVDQEIGLGQPRKPASGRGRLPAAHCRKKALLPGSLMAVSMPVGRSVEGAPAYRISFRHRSLPCARLSVLNPAPGRLEQGRLNGFGCVSRYRHTALAIDRHGPLPTPALKQLKRAAGSGCSFVGCAPTRQDESPSRGPVGRILARACPAGPAPDFSRADFARANRVYAAHASTPRSWRQTPGCNNSRWFSFHTARWSPGNHRAARAAAFLAVDALSARRPRALHCAARTR